MGLKPKVAAFVREYLVDHNATQAAIRAGYSARSAESQGSRLLRNAKVAQAVAEGEKRLQGKAIATREERQRFWTGFMLDPDAHPVARLKASELLGKSEGDFVDRHEVAGEGGEPLTIVLKRRGS